MVVRGAVTIYVSTYFIEYSIDEEKRTESLSEAQTQSVHNTISLMYGIEPAKR